MDIDAMRMLLLVAALAAAAPDPALAQAPFNARPTDPQDCAAAAAARGPGRVWVGRFSGARESIHDGDERGDLIGPPRSTAQVACFDGERDCRNWLYNLQSTYTAAVWTADCRRGLPSD